MPLNLAGIVDESIVDGPGLRSAIFAQGCSFGCPGCQNPQTHAFGTGTDWEVPALVQRIARNPLVRGVTFTGGDPFFQAAGFAALGAALKAKGYEVAAYTGHTWEAILRAGSPEQMALLEVLDVLVDGPFVQAERRDGLRFRGSANQRVIDVVASLAAFKARKGPSPLLQTSPRWSD